MLSMVIDSISSFMYSKLLVIMLIGTGVYFTIRTKFLQVRLFRSACKAVMEKPDDEDAVSSFQALMVSTASRVGTGDVYKRQVNILDEYEEDGEADKADTLTEALDALEDAYDVVNDVLLDD